LNFSGVDIDGVHTSVPSVADEL